MAGVVGVAGQVGWRGPLRDRSRDRSLEGCSSGWIGDPLAVGVARVSNAAKRVEAVEVHQLDDLALFGGELVERGPNRPAFLGQPDLVDDVLGRVRLDDRVRELGLLDAAPLRLLAAHGVDGAVMDHAHQPCTDGPALRVVAARVPPHRQERLLHDLLREERLPDDAARECHGARRVPSEQSSEGFAVATADPLDELPVSGVGEVGRHGNLP